jgi:hypothetical protein
LLQTHHHDATVVGSEEFETFSFVVVMLFKPTLRDTNNVRQQIVKEYLHFIYIWDNLGTAIERAQGQVFLKR